MRGVRRVLSALRVTIAGVALLLGVAAVGFWVAGGDGVYAISTTRGHFIYSVDLHHGGMSLVSFWSRNGPYGNWRVRFHDDYPVVMYGDRPFRWRFLGFGVQRMTFVYERGDVEPSDIVRVFWVPLWFTCAVLFTWSAHEMRWVVRRWRRRRIGVCASCGYDLRATPERCPECGRGVGDGA